MTKQLSEEQLKNNVDQFWKYIIIMSKERRLQLKKMFDEAPSILETYFTAPASSREEFHNCFPGGLLDHSLNVTRNLKRLADTLCPHKYTDDVLAFVGLFHDFGKIGDGSFEYYIPNESDWHRKKGMLYETNKDCVQMPTSERGLFVLQNHGVLLTSEEYLAIRLNDGQYDETNKFYKMKEPELALLVHWADMWSTFSEK